MVQPTFLVDLPLDLWPLVKPQPDHPELLGEAFDGIVAGMEITGGGTDVNDPVEAAPPLRSPARAPGVGQRRTTRTPTTKSSCARSSTGC